VRRKKAADWGAAPKRALAPKKRAAPKRKAAPKRRGASAEWNRIWTAYMRAIQSYERDGGAKLQAELEAAARAIVEYNARHKLPNHGAYLRIAEGELERAAVAARRRVTGVAASKAALKKGKAVGSMAELAVEIAGGGKRKRRRRKGASGEIAELAAMLA
jgi:hypothetical protein